MANNAAHEQLPSMVRKPKMVWPGLDRMGLHHKSIAGDGNCLFASLADQLYGDPLRHDEIRETIIEHMRNFRPLYEAFVHVDDIVQRRATRATTESIRKNATEDAFEDYLILMSKSGVYGGQPELLAFVRAYDQDVMVHLPPETDWNTLTLSYKNDYRESESQSKSPLHICYGGDEISRAHYDSSQKTDERFYDRPLTTRPKSQSKPITPLHSPSLRETLSPRAIRSFKSDPTRDMMHELVTRGSKDIRNSFELLNGRERARSPSVASSHRSTSSKRSFEDDGDQPRAAKRADRKRSLRSRATLAVTALSQSLPTNINNNGRIMSSDPPSPASSQNSDSSSERVESGREGNFESSASSPPAVYSFSEDQDSQEYIANSQTARPGLRKKNSGSLRRSTVPHVPSLATERPRSTLQA